MLGNRLDPDSLVCNADIVVIILTHLRFVIDVMLPDPASDRGQQVCFCLGYQLGLGHRVLSGQGTVMCRGQDPVIVQHEINMLLTSLCFLV